MRTGILEDENTNFHKLITQLQKLGTRRNEIVHSKYYNWTNVAGEIGLLRQNSKLRGGKGKREDIEEELLPKDLWSDLGNLINAYNQLESFRRKIIDWVCPIEPA